MEYLDLPQEPPAIIESNRPPAYWPSSTSENRDSMLVVQDLVVKYAPDLPAILKGVSFSLRAKERVGLLGRTGSGKSTLAMSVLRFVSSSLQPSCSEADVWARSTLPEGGSWSTALTSALLACTIYGLAS